ALPIFTTRRGSPPCPSGPMAADIPAVPPMSADFHSVRLIPDATHPAPTVRLRAAVSNASLIGIKRLIFPCVPARIAMDSGWNAADRPHPDVAGRCPLSAGERSVAAGVF